MSQNRSQRVSRPLIAALGVTIVLGLFFYLHNARRSRAEEPKPVVRISAPVAAPASLLPPAPALLPAQPAALVTETPTQASPASPANNAETPLARPKAGSVATAGSPAGPAVTAPAAPAIVTPAPIVTGHALADARSKKDSGDLLGARDLLNAAIASDKISEADREGARQLATEVNKTVFLSPQRFADDPWQAAYAVQSGERLSTIAGKNDVSWELLARVNGIEPRRLRSGTSIKVIKGPFHAVISKSKFRMDVYLGSPGEARSMFFASLPVGLGKEDSTPTGSWVIQPKNKVRHPIYYSPRGEGVIAADDPKNPLGGYWLGLEGQEGKAVGKSSYGIHGTIDPDSIGKQASMGCIRLRADDIALVFDLLVEGKSRVVVKD